MSRLTKSVEARYDTAALKVAVSRPAHLRLSIRASVATAFSREFRTIVRR